MGSGVAVGSGVDVGSGVGGTAVAVGSGVGVGGTGVSVGSGVGVGAIAGNTRRSSTGLPAVKTLGISALRVLPLSPLSTKKNSIKEPSKLLSLVLTARL